MQTNTSSTQYAVVVISGQYKGQYLCHHNGWRRPYYSPVPELEHATRYTSAIAAAAAADAQHNFYGGLVVVPVKVSLSVGKLPGENGQGCLKRDEDE